MAAELPHFYREMAREKFANAKTLTAVQEEERRQLNRLTRCVRDVVYEMQMTTERPDVGNRAAAAAKIDLSLGEMVKLFKNIQRNASEPRFRRIRTTNERLRENILDAPMALDVFRAVGWVEDGEYLVLPESITADYVGSVLHQIERAVYNYQHREAIAEKKAKEEERARIQARVAADKADRAARPKPTGPSVARPLKFKGGGEMQAKDVCNTRGGG